MNKEREAKPIDNVTVNNLDAVLKVLDITIDKDTLDIIIDAVELIEEKGDKVSISDIFLLHDQRVESKPFNR